MHMFSENTDNNLAQCHLGSNYHIISDSSKQPCRPVCNCSVFSRSSDTAEHSLNYNNRLQPLPSVHCMPVNDIPTDITST